MEIQNSMNRSTVPAAALVLLLACFTVAAQEQSASAKNDSPQSFRLGAASFGLDFEVHKDHRLYQHAIAEEGVRLNREDEAFPQAGDGYFWEPALQVTHADGNTSTSLQFVGITRTNEAAERELTRITLRDPAYDFQVVLCFRVHRPLDVIEQWAEITHAESAPVTLHRMASTALRLGKNVQLTHFFGDWAREMQHPIVEKLTIGTKVLDSKLGVRASQYQNPNFLLSWDGPPDETHGRVLAGSLAWSGNFQFEFEDFGRGVRALCGLNPFNSEYHLVPHQLFATPVMIWAWSADGVGDVSRKLHAWAREFGLRDGHALRPVLLNNWEATGFDFDFQRLTALYDPAKEIGAELFLLDDGWFGNKYPRLNDRAGLGDWQPNAQRLPRGLEPLAAEAARRDLRFGIWIEPEMVNPKSELFDQHPEWAIRQPKRGLDEWRHQLVLDLTRPEVQAFEWQAIKNTLGVPGVTFAKWDCNRYITQPGSPWLPADRQSHLWIDYVHALYDLMAKTKNAFPKTELMLCSGGGGRADYGALPYFHEFWPTDNTDPVARIHMQWNYSYFFPAAAMASHVTHSGNRPLHFACCVAMSECFGMDIDLIKMSLDDKAILTGAVRAYKDIRNVVQRGDLFRLENPDHGDRAALNYVAPDRSRAVLFVFRLLNESETPVQPQGLDPQKRYRVRELNPAPGRHALALDGKTLSGTKIMREGIVPSATQAMEACAIEFTAVSDERNLP